MAHGTVGPQRLLVGLGGELHTRALIGGKGASLSHLCALGAPVPAAVALTTHAYRAFAASLGLPDRMDGIDERDLPEIRATVLQGPMPTPVAEAIASAFDSLEDGGGQDPALAVRSSATAEDSAERSFAGLHDTILDVCTVEEVEAAVRHCWASLWSDRAVSYRRNGGLGADMASIAVVLQRLVRSDVSFVVFTVDPITGDDRHAVISASWGLGEAIVSGMVTPDHIVVGANGEIVEHTVGSKERMVIPGASPGDGTRLVAVPRILRDIPAMSATQATEVAGLARSVARRLGFPADLEGGIVGDELYLFQARPITTLALQPKLDRAAAVAGA